MEGEKKLASGNTVQLKTGDGPTNMKCRKYYVDIHMEYLDGTPGVPQARASSKATHAMP
jgi:hypothetical protein